jgi:hypothetical protein
MKEDGLLSHCLFSILTLLTLWNVGGNSTVGERDANVVPPEACRFAASERSETQAGKKRRILRRERAFWEDQAASDSMKNLGSDDRLYLETPIGRDGGSSAVGKE